LLDIVPAVFIIRQVEGEIFSASLLLFADLYSTTVSEVMLMLLLQETDLLFVKRICDQLPSEVVPVD
jgi:hypothetical protein